MTTFPAPNFGHLLRLSDRRGTFEHAELSAPRTAHGYCTDDMARVLVVTCRQQHPSATLRELGMLSLRFLADAQAVDGRFRNRMDEGGRWKGSASVEDCWGRSIWALGTVAATSDTDWMRQSALAMFQRAGHHRSPWLRAMAYAALGAAEVLAVHPADPVARGLLAAAADALPTGAADVGWPWPEPRLAYANALVAEAMIAAGSRLGRDSLVEHGLALLRWLLEHETTNGHLSVTPAGGDGPDGRRPAFDQQPIEVASLADACARATTVDGARTWADGIGAAVAWFLGDNDANLPMWDPATGAGFDGLEAGGVNRNQGAESTLAALSTLQHGQRLVEMIA